MKHRIAYLLIMTVQFFVACSGVADSALTDGAQDANTHERRSTPNPWGFADVHNHDGGAQKANKPQKQDGGSEPKPASESESESETEGAIAEPSCNEPPNHVRGGNFEIEPFADCGWQTHAVLDWGVLTVRECDLEDHPGCAALIASEGWGDDWVALFYQYLTLEPGNTYELSFEARSVREPRGMIVALLGAGPEGGLGNGMPVALWPDQWTTFTNRFIATEEATIYSELVFAIGGAENYLYLDHVSIVPARISADTDE